MNDIRFVQFENFEKDWKLVTVRFREDTKEMRFTFANNLAWQVLNQGGKNFPQGAAFAKIGFVSEKDILFTSSAVPSGAKRYQFMIRDENKYKETDGWGYALFNAKGKTFNGEPGANSLACAACHKLASNRGFVFSEIMEWRSSAKEFKDSNASGANAAGANASESNKSTSQVASTQQIRFEKTKRAKIATALTALLPNDVTEVFEVVGNLKNNLFEGTVNEIIPLLIEKTLSTKKAAMLSRSDGGIFAVAFLEKNSAVKCKKGDKSIKVIRTIQRDIIQAEFQEQNIKVTTLCR